MATLEDKIVFEVKGSVFKIDKRYDFLKQIGQGAYGIVVACYDNKNKKKVAIKKIPKAYEDLIDAKRIYREIKIMSSFKHENIISLVDLDKGEISSDDI